MCVYIYIFHPLFRKDMDKIEKINAFREAMKRLKLGPDTMPSICFYTFINSYRG